MIAKAISIQVDESFEYSMKVRNKVAKTEGYKIINEITHIDYLTGLKNQKGFLELGDTSLKYCQAMGQGGLMVYFDIKNLNIINDGYGRPAGDHVLKSFAEILTHNFRANDIVARIEGDKFAVISSGLTVDTYKKIVSDISDECQSWKEKSGQPFDINVTSCFVMFPSLKYNYDIDGLMDNCAESLAKAKKQK